VDSTATPGFVSNANLFWNSTSQAPIKYAGTKYATLAAFTAATGHDAASLQADPWFVHPVGGDFRLLPGSPAIDAADSSVPNWPATDAAGNTRVDDPATRDTGVGPVLYADRGALEFLPVGPPLAALTVRPSSGIAPLTVTADASRSADPDGTIVSYLYNFGDGTVVGPQAAATASHTYQQVGTFTVTVTVTDAEGGTAAATAPVTVAPPNEPPVAALTVTPASGTVPLAVTADASASSDLDGTLVAYRFDFGDGTVLSPQAAPTATHTYFRPGIFTVTVTVTDDLGATASVTVTVTVAAPQSWNFVENPSFEFGTRGWTAYGGATILQVPGGVEGAYALQVRGPASTATFGINDSPNWVGQTSAAGDRYRFTAWVRSPTSSARARLRVREYLNGVQVGGTTYSPFVALTPAWQPLLVDHVAQAASSSLDFQVLALPLAPGAIFETDHIAIRIVTTTSNQPPDGGIDSPAGDVTIGRCQSVHFTSTGSDPDNHLPLTYLWDFAGGEAQQRGEDPGHVEFCTLGTYIVTLTVEDSLGLADPTPARRVITVFPGRGDNQVGNPSFETDTKGWGTYGGSTIQRVAGGLEGAFALEVRGPASTATFGINDSPNWVAKTLAAGTPYSFSAWVRAEASTGRVRLRVREYLNGVQVGATTYSPFVPLTSAWQLLSAGHVAQAAGSTLDVQILDYPVAPGEVFQVDNIFIFVP
jgi:PKD repeat protein